MDEFEEMSYVTTEDGCSEDVSSIDEIVAIESRAIEYGLPRVYQMIGAWITDADMPSLSIFTELVELNLSRYSDSDIVLSNISVLSWCTKLQTLDLSGTTISDIKALSKCTQLEELKLFETEISDIKDLSTCTQLKELDFSSTKVSNISVLSKCTKLQVLRSECTPVSDFSVLRSLTQLEALSLGRNASESYMSNITPLTQLDYLHLHSHNISSIGAFLSSAFLSSLVCLKRLELSCPQLQASKVIDISALLGLPIQHFVGPSKQIFEKLYPFFKHKPFRGPPYINYDRTQDCLVFRNDLVEWYLKYSDKNSIELDKIALVEASCYLLFLQALRVHSDCQFARAAKKGAKDALCAKAFLSKVKLYSPIFFSALYDKPELIKKSSAEDKRAFFLVWLQEWEDWHNGVHWQLSLTFKMSYKILDKRSDKESSRSTKLVCSSQSANALHKRLRQEEWSHVMSYAGIDNIKTIPLVSVFFNKLFPRCREIGTWMTSPLFFLKLQLGAGWCSLANVKDSIKNIPPSDNKDPKDAILCESLEMMVHTHKVAARESHKASFIAQFAASQAAAVATIAKLKVDATKVQMNAAAYNEALSDAYKENFSRQGFR